jgi:hypothetical protein
MKIYNILLLLVFLVQYKSQAQLDNSFFYDTAQTVVAPEKLYLSIEMVGLHRNTEYFNKIVEGRTLFSTHTIPTLIYSPTSRVFIEAGAFLWKDFGNENYSLIAPFFRLKYTQKNVSLIFGNLEGSLTHQLIEPLYDMERFHTHRTEQGIQLKLNKKRIYSDVWVDWRKMIYQNSPFQEEILGGSNTVLNLYQHEKWKITTPIQLVVKHSGGQINAPSPPDSVRLPAFSLLNVALGADVQFFIREKWVKSLNISSYWVQSYNDLPLLPYVFQSGRGSYINLKVSTNRWGDFYFSHWYGNSYSSAIGGALFRSESTIPSNIGYTEPYRHLILFRYSNTWKITDDLCFLLRFEPSYHFNQNKTELAWGFYLRYQPLFYLFQLKSWKKV